MILPWASVSDGYVQTGRNVTIPKPVCTACHKADLDGGYYLHWDTRDLLCRTCYKLTRWLSGLSIPFHI